MRWFLPAAVLLFFTVFYPIPLQAQEVIHHDLKIILDPTKHLLEIEDTISLPDRLLPASNETVRFILHKGLHPQAISEGSVLTRDKTPTAKKLNTKDGIPVETFHISLPSGQRVVKLTYKGVIHHPIERRTDLPARAIYQPGGLISQEEIFLSGISRWYPWFDDGLLSFNLEIKIKGSWSLISQGDRTLKIHKEGNTEIRWSSPEPQDEILLIGGSFIEYTRAGDHVQAMVFLQKPDGILASQYLEATGRYLDLYSRLIGPYPYKKFALIENFRETGFGMPSLTLLGSKVIRFPFVLNSSYPHEILHNWWGNSVYVDYETGNWAEGLTTYLSDYLTKEQEGEATEYRRTTLQKYTDYVTEKNDFPLTQFRSRRNAVTEAVGYGKTLMFFHMLRRQMGDEQFIRALRKFYQEYQFSIASFSDIEKVFVGVGGKELEQPFLQWITQTGAPHLRVRQPRIRPDSKGYRLKAVVEQIQSGPAYRLLLPVAVHFEEGKEVFQTHVIMDQKSFDLNLHVPSRPVRLQVDPEFDIFRRLAQSEIPPALTGSFGAEKVMVILPSNAPKILREGFHQLARSWEGTELQNVEIRWDDDVKDLPPGYAVWLFGWNNRFAEELAPDLSPFDVSMTDEGVYIEQNLFARGLHSIVLSVRHPKNPDLTLTWVATSNVQAIPGLARKLPHYGKYSYLAFEGDAPTNVAKGVWPIVDSPMTVFIPQEDGTVMNKVSKGLAHRPALSDLLPQLYK